MPILELHRSSRPLSMAERAALPPDCLWIEDDGEVVARWDGRSRTRIECLYAAAAMANPLLSLGSCRRVASVSSHRTGAHDLPHLWFSAAREINHLPTMFLAIILSIFGSVALQKAISS